MKHLQLQVDIINGLAAQPLLLLCNLSMSHAAACIRTTFCDSSNACGL